MRQPNVWVIKCREHLADGSDGWHWRYYLPATSDWPLDEPVKDWGGDDWIRSPYSKKLLRDDVSAGDIGICYQRDDPACGRSILGFTRFLSRGKEESIGSGQFNCFDLCPPNEAFVLTPPLQIKDLHATGCHPACFGPSSQGTIFPMTRTEFEGVLAAVRRYAPNQGANEMARL